MNICFPLPPAELYGPAGGGAITTITRHLAAELTGAGHRVTVLTPDDAKPTFPEGDVRKLHFGPARPISRPRRKAHALYARTQGWASRAYPPYLRSALSLVRHLEPSTVVCANDPILARVVAARMPQVTPVLWLHNLMVGADAAQMRALPERVRIIAVSRYVADWTVSAFGLAEDRVTVVYSGVDSAAFFPRVDFAEPSSPVRVISHGRIDPNKGHDIALRAVGQLRSEGLPIEITLLGGVQTFDWPKDDLARYLASLEAAIAYAQADWPGRVPHGEVAKQLREHDIACVLSRSEEPYALTSLEAMASGCAVIGARAGGIPEAIQEGGVLVDKDSVDQVATSLRRFLADPAALTEAKLAARRVAFNRTWADTAHGFLRVIGSRR